MNTKELIAMHLASKTQQAFQQDSTDSSGLDAFSISMDLKLDRSNVSRYLNALHREGRLIKVSGRPTLYYARRVIETAYPDSFFPSTLPIGSTIQDYFVSDISTAVEPAITAFDQYLVNDRSSFSLPIQKAKAAVLYPPFGLNTLITGKASVGKHDFVTAIFSYGKSKHIFAEHKKLYEFDCALYAEKYTENIFTLLYGHFEDGVYKPGLIENARNSVLVLTNFEYLSDTVVKLLKLSLSKQEFIPVAASIDQKPIKIKTMIIGLTESQDYLGITGIKSLFPIQIHLPSLHERSIDEMLFLTLTRLQKESADINKTIRVSKGVLSCLVMADYPENLSNLSAEIKQACANAYQRSLNSDAFFIDLDFVDISNQILESIHDINDRIDDLNDLLILFDDEHLFFSPVQSNKELELLYEINRDNTAETTDPVGKLEGHLIDLCIRDINYVTSIRLNTIRSVLLKDIYQELYPLFTHSPLIENENLLYGLLSHLSTSIKQIKHGSYSTRFERQSHQIANSDDYAFAREIKENVEMTYSIVLPEYELDYIATYLYLSSQWTENKYIQILIILKNSSNSKNYSTYLNSLNHKSTAYSLEYNAALPFEEMLQTIQLNLENIDKGKGVIIATDVCELLQNQDQLKNTVTSEVVFFEGITVQSLVTLLQRIDSLDVSLSTFQGNQPVTPDIFSQEASDTHAKELLNDIANKLLSESLVFLNPSKSSNLLYSVLNRIIDELNIEYSDELLVKFIFHCCFVIERCIRKDPINDHNARAVISANPAPYYIIEKQFSIINETFSINIPNSELGMVVEIFLPYL